MICPRCDGRMHVQSILQIPEENSETRDLKCPDCGFRATTVTVLIYRPQDRKGTVSQRKGARAAMNQIRELGIVEALQELQKRT